jgi:CoA:oxalate CoA-transferase
MALPLTGIRVLDVTNVLAGPFCSYQLALMGAEVIKIEQPGSGDLARRLGADHAQFSKLMGASFVAVNAGKQSVTLNLKNENGKKIFKDLTAQSHVVVENFRPGVMKRLGLDYTVLSKVNSGLVYCAISGFGQEGPLAQRPAYDQVIQGMAGVMSVTGDEKSAPLRVGYPVCDTVGGITAAFAISAALVGAKTTGEGQMIDVSMLESSLATMGWVVSNYLNCGVVPQPMGNQNFTASPSGTFQTADRPLNIAANEDSQFRSLCDLIERPDLKTDLRFAERTTRKNNRAAMNAEIEPELLRRSAEEWETLMVAAGIPAGRVLTVPEILAHSHLAQSRFVTSFPASVDADATTTTTSEQHVTRGGFQLEGEAAVPSGPAPVLSEHTEVWLGKLGYDENQIVALRTEGTI